MDGWLKLWRKLGDSELWLAEPFTRGQAWVDLLMLANHTDGYLRKRGIRVEVRRGQVGWSEGKLAKRWQWSRGKVRRFMSELASEKEQKTVQQKSNITNLNTILNYEQYQGNGTTDGHQTVQQTDTKRYSNKNGKNGKNEKKKELYVETSDEVRLSNLLISKILENYPNFKKPDIQKWAKVMDLTIRKDYRTPQDLEETIEWLFNGNLLSETQFVVQSPNALRKKFDRIQTQRAHSMSAAEKYAREHGLN